jgi:4-amino-4-deoxy-L-arabinose transferase-like glycosyltransferase
VKLLKQSLSVPRITLWILLVLIFALALLIRFYDLFDAPLDFFSTRQMHSALIARGMYFQNLDSAPAWQRELAVSMWKAEPHVEPQILERLVAFTYSLMGGENVWVARVFSILFWVGAGIPLFLLARSLFGTVGALISLAYFLFLPYGAIASRSFQPDPLMVSLIIFTYWAMYSWKQKPNWRWTIAAGLFGGAAILVKSVAVFFVGPPIIALVLIEKGLKKAIRDPQVWVLAALILMPYAAYHIYGVYLAGFLGNEFNLRFFPQLWLDPVWYLQWNGALSGVVGFEWFLVALLGTFVFRKQVERVMFLAAWGGYFLYGMTLPYHIYTHDYYHLPLIPLVALGLGSGAGLLFENLRGSKRVFYTFATCIILFAVVVKAWDVRVSLKRNDYTNEIIFWKNLGKKLGHTDSIIGLTQDSGLRLAYFGWVQSTSWLTSADFNLRQMAGQDYDIQALFEEQIEGKDYFVITLLDELDHQPELKSLLYARYSIYDETSDYVIFDLNKPKGSP